MMISKENTMVMITMSKELLETIQTEAERDGRTVSNWVVHVIKKELKNKTNE